MNFHFILKLLLKEVRVADDTFQNNSECEWVKEPGIITTRSPVYPRYEMGQSLCCWWLILPIPNDAKDLKND